ncbi:fetuin B isoform X1 [Poecilia formosa]|uniref:Fetuin B n=1 Tax=Poecilia formosa TaxID=48698 RepID=A0A096MG59_POEFO|nr:PREDICTED: histidine-rich glycoprotein isoform X1 [Poecilia formosa]
MKTCVLFLLVVGSVYSAPVEQGGIQPGSCEDPSAVSASHLALSKINLDRVDGYVFSLHQLSNVHLDRHGENGVVYYLTLDVVETNCSVISRRDWKKCEARPETQMPVYGQCKAAIYINKPHRVVRLYKYDCVIRPVPAARVTEICPDCPTFISFGSEQVQKTVSRSLEKFNNESGLNNHFALLKILRASAGMAMDMYYNVEYTIQETVCGKYKQPPAGEKCPIMTCEFSHKGFCKASLINTPAADEDISVECEIYEQEAAEREKVQHLLGDATDHPHNDTHRHEHGKGHDHDKEHGKGHSRGHGHRHGQGGSHEHGQGGGHGHGQGGSRGHGHHGGSHERGQGGGRGHGHHNRSHEHGHGRGQWRGHLRLSEHDHIHDHTKDHSHHDVPHPDGSKHHHTHDHKPGSAYRHGHAHSHDHGIDGDHDHVHAYHAKAQNHTGGFPNQHHNYTHPAGTHTHDHDHEHALDHEHNHAHLHEHEHHHHHHLHEHETEQHDEPEGLIRTLPAIDQPMILPSFPDVPAAGPEVGVTLPLKPDPSIPGQTEPTILPFPTSRSAECANPAEGKSLVNKLFLEDPLFKPAA